jgi:hypothetical protein
MQKAHPALVFLVAFSFMGIGAGMAWNAFDVHHPFNVGFAFGAFLIVLGIAILLLPQQRQPKAAKGIDLVRDAKNAKRLLLFQSIFCIFMGALSLLRGIWFNSDPLSANTIIGTIYIAGGLLFLWRYQCVSKQGIDPVAEASVYLAYGNDIQAEELSKAAMLTQPERIAIHRKLAEIYAKRRDTSAFQTIATQAREVTRGEGADWLAIVALGSKLDSANPLYQH